VTSYKTALTKLAKMTVVMTLRKSQGRYRKDEGKLESEILGGDGFI
jgi:hypothetical protein